MDNFLDFESFKNLRENEDSENLDMIFEDYTEIIDKIEGAMDNKFVCQIYYKGEQKGVVDDGYREIEPLRLGVNKHGNTILRAWLIRGVSRTGKTDPSVVPGFRLFRLDRISMISPTLSKFTGPRKGYGDTDIGMTEISYSVKF